MSERHMIALWTTRRRFIPARESLQNLRRKSSLMATSSIIPAKCQWTIGTRFMKRSRRSVSSVLQCLLLICPETRRAETRTSHLLGVRSGVVSLGQHGSFGGIVEELQSLREGSADSDSAWRLTQPPLGVFALHGYLLERGDKAFHLALLPNCYAHVIWQSGK